jgi:hypothetical protein
MRALIADVDAKLVDQAAQEFRDRRHRVVTDVIDAVIRRGGGRVECELAREMIRVAWSSVVDDRHRVGEPRLRLQSSAVAGAWSPGGVLVRFGVGRAQWGAVREVEQGEKGGTRVCPGVLGVPGGVGLLRVRLSAVARVGKGL